MNQSIRNKFVIIAAGALVVLSYGQSVDYSVAVGNVPDSTGRVVKEAGSMDIAFENTRNTRTDTVDGIVFTVSTDRKVYRDGDTIRVRYSLKNRSMATVLFDFNTTCQFDLQVADRHGTVAYSLLSIRACIPDSSRIQLPPSGEKKVDFDPVPLDLKKSDSLTVKAQMAGYPLSAVPVKVRWETAEQVSSVVALEGRAGNKPVLEFNNETKMLVIRVDRAQRLTISAFIMTGQKVNKLSCEKFLAPGTHLISFNNKKLVDGVVVFKVEGNGFSESKKINLSR